MVKTISFSVTSDAKSGGVTKQFELQEGNVIRIGRSPAADFNIEHRGVSQYHAEFKVSTEGDKPKLVIKDVSSNGTGLKRQDAESAPCLKKDVEEPVPDGSVLLVPHRLKENHSGRAWLTISLGAGGASKKSKKEKKAKEVSAEEDDAASGSADGDGEAARKAFVELLLKTRDINGGTKYEEAEKMLDHEPAWKACPAATRKDCFNIFVEHLGDSSGKKKDKKKKDKSGKKKGKRAASGSPEAAKKNGKRKRDGSRSESRKRGGGGRRRRAASADSN
eukprot:TRINITY_DN101141_c0_g1_i1.p1 TRINITY_DN101141_c0_g1~~TRINITY_DN101141_c0_g1_i1.p1  ORF type:complete len:307 (-),score=98.36 TRINITY_DN101141_c0_g1_i1:113-943(-)